MSLIEQIKKEFHTECQKMKDMSLQDRLWYIWEYYKFHICGIFIAVFILYIIASSVYNSTIHPGLYCIIVNNRSAEELDLSILEHDFHDLMEFDKKEPVYVESMYISYGDQATELSYASMAKISALVASKELDILISDKETTQNYTSLDGLSDLNLILPDNILSAVKDRLRYFTNEAGQSIASSLDISGTSLAESMHLSKDASNLSIFSNSTHIDSAIALICYIFDL